MQLACRLNAPRASKSAIRLRASRPHNRLRAGYIRPRGPVRVYAFVSEVGKYLAEAASQIFSDTKSDVPWSASTTPFTGPITHHEDLQRLEQLYDIVQTTKARLGCTDPGALNFDASAATDDGSCQYLPDEGVLQEHGVGGYLTGAVKKVFGSNFKNAEGESGPNWVVSDFSGDIVRNQREIEKLLHFEKVVKHTLDQASK